MSNPIARDAMRDLVEKKVSHSALSSLSWPCLDRGRGEGWYAIYKP